MPVVHLSHELPTQLLLLHLRALHLKEFLSGDAPREIDQCGTCLGIELGAGLARAPASAATQSTATRSAAAL